MFKYETIYMAQCIVAKYAINVDTCPLSDVRISVSDQSSTTQTEDRGKNRRRVSSIRGTQGSSAERNCSKTLNTRSKLKLRRVDSPSIRVTVFGGSTHYVAEGRSPGRSFMTDLHPTAPCAFFAWQKFS